MKCLTAIGAAAAAAATFLTGSVHAQEIQSKPFHLVLKSATGNLDGVALRAVQTEGNLNILVAGPKYKQNDAAAQTFRWNTTRDQPHTGLLTYIYTQTPGNVKSEQVMQFQVNAATNVAFPLFTFSTQGQNVHFDDKGRMFVEGFVDDHLSGKQDKGARHYRWQVCRLNEVFGATALAWTLGKYPPQNPTCKSVEIYRFFNK